MILIFSGGKADDSKLAVVIRAGAQINQLGFERERPIGERQFHVAMCCTGSHHSVV